MYSPSDARSAKLLQKAQKSLNQTIAAGTRVAEKCGVATASVTASGLASATDSASATSIDGASTVTKIAPSIVTDLAVSATVRFLETHAMST
jgi:hypothetical protein